MGGFKPSQNDVVLKDKNNAVLDYYLLLISNHLKRRCFGR
jgi:hypothetical protein